MLNRTFVLLSLSVLALLVIAVPAGAQRYVAGAAGLGDPFFPKAGNGGYDVRHYKLKLSYDAAPVNELEGAATVRARATRNLYRFNLDFRPFYEISSLTVDGRRASYRLEDEHELVITPRRRLRRGQAFKVVVRYAGAPEAVIDPDDSEEGWIPTDDGAFVVNEPQGSPGWYPANDNPRDKATYDVTVSVPEGRTVIGNGELVKLRTRGGRTTWRWREETPMAPYLATATNGNFDTRFYSSGGRRFYDAVDPNTRTSAETAPNPALAWERLATQAEAVDFFSGLYGDYPFTTAGGIVDFAPSVGYALESQTRANYHRTPSATTVVHEISHQWFGNAVTLAVWPDIWLNEGFARWSQWIYDERHAGPTAQSRFETSYARPAEDAFWKLPPGNVGVPEELFASAVYERGAMTLQALRQKVGDDVFFGILRAWYAENRYGNVTTADFVALSERESGQQLDSFFRVWLYQAGKPASW